jgi:hypothetical protein
MMQVELRDTQLVLKDAHLLSLREAGGRRLCCTRGALWITLTNLPGDVFLGAGEEWTVPDQGLVLIETLVARSELTIGDPRDVRVAVIEAECSA